MRGGKVFFDTNVLAYAQDRDAPSRRERSQLSFWDALIVIASVSSGCTTIYSEARNAGQSIKGVRIVNPFV